MAGFGVFPDVAFSLVEKERRVARVFGVNVDLTGQQRLADNLRAAQLQTTLDWQARVFEGKRNDIAQQPAFGVDLGRYGDVSSCRGGKRGGEGRGGYGCAKEIRHGMQAP